MVNNTKYSKSRQAYVPRKAYAPRSQVAKPRKVYARSAPSQSGIKKIATLGGTALGGYFGGPLGASLGGAAGSTAADLFKKVTGMGDYTIKSNTLYNIQDATPSFKQMGRNVRVCHREYICDVITSPVASAFKQNSFLLNPAESITYPWLSTIAQQFEQYRIHGMIFHFKSNSADALNSTNTALGSVVAATQYNVQLAPFTNKQAMENYEFASSTRPSADLFHPVECDPSQTSFGPIYDIKLGGDDSGDSRLYQHGRFNLATVGMQGTSTNIGELWVTYDIELLKPRLGDSPSGFAHWRTSVSPPDATPFLGAVISEDSDFDATISGSNTLVFPPNFNGNVIVILKGAATGAVTMNTFGFTLSSGISPLQIVPAPVTSGYDCGSVSATSFSQYRMWSIVSGGVSQTALFSGGTSANCNLGLDLMVFTIPNTMLSTYVAESLQS